jgi:hypothetical protein
MKLPHRLIAASVLGIALVSAPLPAAAASPGWERVFQGFRSSIDIVVLRPLGVARLVLGGAILLPMSTVLNAVVFPIGRDTRIFVEDWDRFVVEPAEYTFQREIGEELAGG